MDALHAHLADAALILDLCEAAQVRAAVPEFQAALEAHKSSRPAADPLAEYLECEVGGDVRAAVEACGPLGDEGRELTVALPAEPIHLDADGMRLAQVLQNLLTNAVKYTKPGGHIHVAAARAGGDVVVRVADVGIGVRPESVPRLVELFYQADRSLERTQSGLGIGLTLSKSLVELHGGTIEIHSEGLGKGCEAVVRLTGLYDTADSPSGAPLGQTAETVTVPRRILVADDSADAAAALAALLRLAGHDVQWAADGQEAVEAAARFAPDAAVVDLAMPRLNGYEVARRIRAEPWGRTMLLIALTGWAKDEDRRKTKEAGFDAHLAKPASPAALLALLSTTRAGGWPGA
jgi:CheY-like chemotaxis protein